LFAESSGFSPWEAKIPNIQQTIPIALRAKGKQESLEINPQGLQESKDICPVES
jgi:hypothetical protein